MTEIWRYKQTEVVKGRQRDNDRDREKGFHFLKAT